MKNPRTLGVQFSIVGALVLACGATPSGGAPVTDVTLEVVSDVPIDDPGTATDDGKLKDAGADGLVPDGTESAAPDAETPAEVTLPPSPTFPIVDTDQAICFDTSTCLACPVAGWPFAGQDAQVVGAKPAYRDNGDGTVTDLVTGLHWQKDPGAKQSYAQAIAGGDAFTLAGYDDWRVPTIKELYSLIRFNGEDPSGIEGSDTSGLVPFLDTAAFVFSYGDTSAGQRLIDSQWVTSTVYTGTVFGGQECFFGVNFADGRIKCYPTSGGGRSQAGYYALYVRGPASYGVNAFADNGDGTVTDKATGLTWQQADSGAGMTWQDALAHCEALALAGYDDWRLPNAKELQGLVDYTRSPDATASPAIDPILSCTGITNEAAQPDFPCYWTSTTHVNGTAGHQGANAAYVAFGRALGYMNGAWIDVHGAGAQRSDPKAGDPADWPTGHGPQGDAIRILNYVRCVRAGDIAAFTGTGETCGGGTSPGACGDGTCDVGENLTCPADCAISAGPTPCTVQADCEAAGACPPDAPKGCACSTTPQGTLCIPACDTTADCPEPPDQTLTCGAEGLCRPQGRPGG